MQASNPDKSIISLSIGIPNLIQHSHLLKVIQQCLETFQTQIPWMLLWSKTFYPENIMVIHTLLVIQVIIFSNKSKSIFPSIQLTSFLEIRKTVASRYSSPEAPLTGEDVIITSGASHAIELCISALAHHGSNILCPAPGFSLYQTICEYKNVDSRFYRLQVIQIPPSFHFIQYGNIFFLILIFFF